MSLPSKKSASALILPITTLFFLALSFHLAKAWVNPTQNPPGGGSAIRIESGTPANSIYIKSDGNVGIGTTLPGAKLEVAGQIKITGGSPGANKLLTSDTAGLATWTDVLKARDPDTTPTLTQYSNLTESYTYSSTYVRMKSYTFQKTSRAFTTLYIEYKLRLSGDATIGVYGKITVNGVTKDEASTASTTGIIRSVTQDISGDPTGTTYLVEIWAHADGQDFRSAAVSNFYVKTNKVYDVFVN